MSIQDCAYCESGSFVVLEGRCDGCPEQDDRCRACREKKQALETRVDTSADRIVIADVPLSELIAITLHRSRDGVPREYKITLTPWEARNLLAALATFFVGTPSTQRASRMAVKS